MIRNFLLLSLLAGCLYSGSVENQQLPAHSAPLPVDTVTTVQTQPGSWAQFLQELPVVDSPVVDYRGRKIRQQWKSAGIIPFDVGNRDLQQCADALIRLRAEYLYREKRYNEIGFHFVSGDYYSFDAYCKGKRPVPSGSGVRFVDGEISGISHQALRKYLDLVYTYASTLSLSRKLDEAKDFGIGTMVVYGGSPGHCFIIIDEGKDKEGKRVFRLAEGYTPAQSMYVLKDPVSGTVWHRLEKGTIETASYTFTSYRLKKFE